MTDTERPLRTHLQELRWRLLKVVIAVLLGAIVAAIFFEPLIKILENKGNPDWTLSKFQKRHSGLQ